MTIQEIKRALLENKALIVSARRRNNDGLAAELSQEKERLKLLLNRFCAWPECGVRICHQHEGRRYLRTGFCQLHANISRFYSHRIQTP